MCEGPRQVASPRLLWSTLIIFRSARRSLAVNFPFESIQVTVLWGVPG